MAQRRAIPGRNPPNPVNLRTAPKRRPVPSPGHTPGAACETPNRTHENPDRRLRPGGARRMRVRHVIIQHVARHQRAGARRQPGLRQPAGRPVDGRVHRLRQQLDLDPRADHPAALHRDHERQGRHAVARDRLHRVVGREDLHLHAAAGRQVLQRPADDLGRREVLARADDGGLGRLGLHRRGHQVGRRPDARRPSWST